MNGGQPRARHRTSFQAEPLEPRRLLSAPPDSVPPGSGVWAYLNAHGDVTRPGDISYLAAHRLYAVMPPWPGTYRLFTTSDDLNVQMRLYGDAGQPVTDVIDANPAIGGEAWEGELNPGQWTYVAVTGFEAEEGTFRFIVEGPEAPATVLAIGGPEDSAAFDGDIDYGGGIEVLRVTAPADATTLKLRLAPAAGFDGYLDVYDPATGRRLDGDSTGGAGEEDLLTLRGVAGGAEYLVAVSGAGRVQFGAYRLEVDFDTPAPGDANDDGRIDAADYFAADRGQALGLGGWANGDFDASGAVTIDDYLILDSAFMAGAAQGPLAAAAPPAVASAFDAAPPRDSLFGAAPILA